MDLKSPTYEEQLGFEIEKLPGEYLPNLLQIVRLFRESVMLKPAEDSFSQGWKLRLKQLLNIFVTILTWHTRYLARSEIILSLSAERQGCSNSQPEGE